MTINIQSRRKWAWKWISEILFFRLKEQCSWLQCFLSCSFLVLFLLANKNNFANMFLNNLRNISCLDNLFCTGWFNSSIKYFHDLFICVKTFQSYSVSNPFTDLIGEYKAQGDHHAHLLQELKESPHSRIKSKEQKVQKKSF